MVNVNPTVGHLEQVTQYDCWHAALRMMLKWKYGPGTEPTGTYTSWLYIRCREAQAGYTNSRANELKNVTQPTDLDKYNASRTAKNVVQRWARTRALGGGFEPFKNATRPGLTITLLPMILGENRLRAVRGAAIAEELDDSPADIGNMLTAHGPLYCLANFGHVVVVTGIDDQTLDVCDPLLRAPSTMGIGLVVNSPCVARLA